MNRSHPLVAALAVALLSLPGSAQAFTCYTLYDRADNVIYRDAVPPVDMSNDGDAQRLAMRSAGQFLVFAEAETCPPVEFKFGESGSRTLSVDNVIGGLRPMTITRQRAPVAGGPMTGGR